MKNKIFQEDAIQGIRRPRNIDDLWDRIVTVWNQVPANMLIKIRANYRAHRIDKLIAAGGHRFENEHY